MIYWEQYQENDQTEFVLCVSSSQDQIQFGSISISRDRNTAMPVFSDKGHQHLITLCINRMAFQFEIAVLYLSLSRVTVLNDRCRHGGIFFGVALELAFLAVIFNSAGRRQIRASSLFQCQQRVRYLFWSLCSGRRFSPPCR